MWLLMWILATLAAFPSSLLAQDSSAVYISNLGQNNNAYNVTFAINLATQPDVLHLYLSAPASNSWTGIGIGQGMKGSLMFVVYADSNGKNVTLSPRIATEHSEPSYNKSISYEFMDGSGIFNGTIVANFLCHNCLVWQGGSLDVNSKTQPFIYAVGPDQLQLDSNALDAGLRRHEHYGQFTMDMVSATGDPAGFPGDLSKPRNSTTTTKDHNDYDYGSPTHAVFMVVAFVILLPFGAAYLRLNNVLWHSVMQSIGAVGAVVGIGVSLNISQEYNRSKHYNSAHQLIGLLVLFLIIIQWTFGGIHHKYLYKKHPHPSTLSKIHRMLGPFVILLGIVNSFLGFSFASDTRHMVVNGLLIVFVAAVIAGCFFLKSRRDRRRGAFTTPAAQNFQSAYVPAQNQFDIPLEQQSMPPAYQQSRPMLT